MLIALLAVLGVDLIVIVAFLAVVLARRRWVTRQPDVFKGAIRVVDGDAPGLSTKWRRGYGLWVRDVLVWEKKPFLFRGAFVLPDALTGPAREAEKGEVKRLGKNVVVTPMVIEGGARIDLASANDDREQVYGPLRAQGRGTTTS
ncbi:hypothetical protein [Streptomyces sp. RKAG293]|uniref:hypothetical protein n=1 Tax=Streptomyces sp. RKAG293 TaxID=2893403 RepID=UPI0020344F3D|nr:hypothetical protein [Streptomyces sp. RKAG293]MCM2416711.1 hypothetical protein [Streptomyces sp. RKAG293]